MAGYAERRGAGGDEAVRAAVHSGAVLCAAHDHVGPVPDGRLCGEKGEGMRRREKASSSI